MTTQQAQSNLSPRSRKLCITRITHRPAGGAWVHGTLMHFTFEALVFPEHAVYRDYEIEQSRISKLCLRRQSDRVIVYAWDRGLDIPVTDASAQRAVSILCARLVSMVYDREP